MLEKRFQSAYARSLHTPLRSFYDDVSIYGNTGAAHCVYFIHGMDGSAGQVRFALPAASRFFGSNLYVKCLYTPEFSSCQPIWDKYTSSNLEKRVLQIVIDLTQLASRYKTINVFCSSNGFYDFYAAALQLDETTRSALTLFWVACAPDRFEDTIWEQVFFKLNGFVHHKHRWVALPNSNWLGWLNAEAPYRYLSKAQKPAKYFYKHDIESRFFLYGTLWSYCSISGFNHCLDYLLETSQDKLDIPTYVLAAEKDGYWQGKTMEDMECMIAKYVMNYSIISRPTSHLWVAAPEHVYALLQTAYPDGVKA